MKLPHLETVVVERLFDGILFVCNLTMLDIILPRTTSSIDLYEKRKEQIIAHCDVYNYTVESCHRTRAKIGLHGLTETISSNK